MTSRKLALVSAILEAERGQGDRRQRKLQGENVMEGQERENIARREDADGQKRILQGKTV